MVAAEAMSEVEGDTADDRASALWRRAAQLHSKIGDGSYSWATLRAVALHGLAMQGLRETSEEAAVQLLSLMSEVSPAKRSDESGLFFSKFDEDNDNGGNGGPQDDSVRSDDMADATSYIAAGESVVTAARTYVRETRAKVAQAQRANFFSGVGKDSSLLAVAQSKWVEDDPIPTILLPMAEFSELSEEILAMRCVWSAIKFEQCFSAQKRIVKEITTLRRRGASSSLVPRNSSNVNATTLPIRITAVVMVETESHSKLERVKLKIPEKDTGAMATFFNPYANKKGKIEATIVPEEDERYVLVRFANNLSIPLEVPRCQLEFNQIPSHRIKAPAISFVIPGQTKDFAVQFPFIVLKKSDPEEEDLRGVFDIKGVHLTFLARSFFLPLKSPSEEGGDSATELEPNIPDPASHYPRRNYKKTKADDKVGIRSPEIEIVPSQPNLRISFASSPAAIGEDAIIPVPISDGEVCFLPKLYLTNDSGLSGLGQLEELKITATGLPGRSEITLFDLSGDQTSEEGKDVTKANSRSNEPKPLSLSANCNGLDKVNLNGGKDGPASMSLVLTSTPDMGAHIKSCTVNVTFRYRGKAPSTTMEVWRKRVIEIGVLRIKGPRVSSLTFRPDLSWTSAFSELCRAMGREVHDEQYHPSMVQNRDEHLRYGSTDDEEFVPSRLGKDPGVHICGEKVVIILSVANETSTEVTLSRPSGPVGGFEGHSMDTIKVFPGVSAKIPMVISRIDRAPQICEKLSSMTKLAWKSSCAVDESIATETGGTMIPVNRRVRSGTIEIPAACLKSIVDENPTFLSRICKAPCSISVAISGGEENTIAEVAIGKATDTIVGLEMADWVPPEVLKETKVTLEFCCARKGSRVDSDKKTREFVWSGQVRKALGSGDLASKESHKARLIFLSEGDYVVSACVSFERTDNVKEVWWAEYAQHVRVKATREKEGK